jgi:hypothetical protein
MHLKKMSIETYGLPEDQYLELFKKKSLFTLKVLAALADVCKSIDFDINSFSDKFLWDLFQDIIYTTDEGARLVQKELDPEEVKKRQFESMLIPTRDELMEEIKSVNAKVEALTDYLAQLNLK